MHDSEIQGLFKLLDKYRQLPNYQLERRVDIFFAFFMKDIIEAKYLDCQVVAILPEFPIHKAAIEEGAQDNRSVKLDYLVVCNNKLLFVELKTEMNSKNRAQEERMLKAKEKKMPKLLEGLLKIYEATHAKEKYRFLLDELVAINWLKKTASTYFTIKEKELERMEIEIVYLQPNKAKTAEENVIDFEEIASMLRKKGTPFAERFAKSLVCWITPSQEEKDRKYKHK